MDIKIRKKFAFREAALWGLKMAAPLILVVIVERMMGPGSDARASQIMVALLITNLVLGTASFLNLQKAMSVSFGEQDSTES